MSDHQQIKFDAEGLPDLTQLSEEGFVDMVFRISEHHVDDHGWHTLTAEAVHEAEIVGLKIAIQPGMRPGIVKDEIDNTAFYREGILLIRDEANSDRLLEVFEVLYGQPPRRLRFRERLEVTSFALMGDPRNLETDYVKFKIFHDDENIREEYFELYLHVNIPGGIIALNEKDEEYRPFVLKGLSEGDEGIP